MIDNVVVVIRSIGERTEQLCRKLILDQGIPEGQIIIVREKPFSVTMRKSFALGIESNRKYTFCVDADVLLRPGSIAYMIDQFEKCPETVCEIQGLVMDKFFGGARPAGNHLYRNSLLPEVVKRIPEEGIDIRPEYHTLNAMAVDGFSWVGIPYVLGTHDDEQFNIDIYRKCYVHAVKHAHLADLFSAIWKEHAGNDFDFIVALKGFADGFQCRDLVFINKDQPIYQEGFDKTSFEEKGEIDISNVNLDTIERRIVCWEDHPEYLLKFPSKFGLNIIDEPAIEKISLLRKIRQKLIEKGFIKFIIFIVSKLLLFIGDKIKKFSD